MIFSNIANFENIKSNVNEEIKFIFDFINSDEINLLSLGKTKLKDFLFVIKESYNTLNYGESFWESHKSHIDFQYVLSGEELIKFSDSSKMFEVAYDESKDLKIHKGYSSGEIVLQKGDFIIFFPSDIHMPGLSVKGQSKLVTKLVFKLVINQ